MQWHVWPLILCLLNENVENSRKKMENVSRPLLQTESSFRGRSSTEAVKEFLSSSCNL